MSHKWNSENRTKLVYLHKIVTANAGNIPCNQLAYFLHMLRSHCHVWSFLPQFIQNASQLLKLPYELQNRRIWQRGCTIWELSMKCLFHTTIRACSIISFQHKNYVSFRKTTLRVPNVPHIAFRASLSHGLLHRIENEPVAMATSII